MRKDIDIEKLFGLLIKSMTEKNPLAHCPIVNPEFPKEICATTKLWFGCPVDPRVVFCCKDCPEKGTCPAVCSQLKEIERPGVETVETKGVSRP